MTSALNATAAPASLAVAAADAPAKPCAYSIGRRLSLLLATQTVIGLGVLLAVIYGITVMLFQAKHNEQMQGYTHVLADMMQNANKRAGAGEMLNKLAWSAERRPGTFLVVSRADGSEFYRDPPPTFDVDHKTAWSSSFRVTDRGTGDIYTGRLVLDCSQDVKTGQRMAILLLLATLAGGILWRGPRSGGCAAACDRCWTWPTRPAPLMWARPNSAFPLMSLPKNCNP